MPFCGATVKKGVFGYSVEPSPVGPLAGPLPMPMAVCGGGLPFVGPVGKRAYTVRGGGAGEGGAVAGGWLTLWAVRRRSTTTSSIRYTRGRWRSIAQGGRSEWSTSIGTGGRRVWKAS